MIEINPIIVIGSPRSGTSVVARLLQESCGVMMDEGPIKKDDHNPNGYYEDSKVVSVNKIAIDRWQQGKNHVAKVDPVWAINFGKWVGYRVSKYGFLNWGFKDPRCVGFLSWVLQFFNNPTLIYCTRKDEQIIKSQVKKLGMPFDAVVDGIHAYRKIITEQLQNRKYHTIDLSKYIPENELSQRLEQIING